MHTKQRLERNLRKMSQAKVKNYWLTVQFGSSGSNLIVSGPNWWSSVRFASFGSKVVVYGPIQLLVVKIGGPKSDFVVSG